jgi:hypothetical protein
MSVQYTQINGGGQVASNNTSFSAITLTGNIVLLWPTQFVTITPPNPVYNTATFWMDVQTAGGGHTITLPDATLVSTGTTLNFANVSGGAFSFTVNKSDSTFLFTLTQGQSIEIYLNNNTIGQGGAPGSWTLKQGAGQIGVTNINATSSNDNLVIGGVPITSVGTVTFAMANDLLALTAFADGAQGYSARTATDTWALRQILGTNNQIVTTNPKGIAGDTTISLAQNVTGLVSAAISNITIGGIGGNLPNTIAASNGGGSLYFLTQSAGLSQFYTNIALNGSGINFGNTAAYPGASTNFITVTGGAFASNFTLVLPTVAPTNGQALINSSGSSPYQLGWATITTFGGPSTDTAIARYNGTSGSLQNSTILISTSGNITPVTGATNLSLTVQDTGAKSMGIGTVDGNTIAALNVNGNIKLLPNGTGNVEISTFKYPNTDSFYGDVLTTDGAGNIIYSTNIQDNLLINGAFDVNQRGNVTSATYFTNANNSWIADAWILLSDGNNIVNANVVPTSTLAGFTTNEGSAANSLTLTVVTPNKKFGILQLLSLNDSQKLKSQITSASVFVAKAAGSTISNVKMAVVGYTPNSVPSTNIVSAWGATGVNPTLAANWAFIDPPSTAALSTSLVTLDNEKISMGTTYNVVGVFIWIDDATATAADVLYVNSATYNIGPIATIRQPTRFEDEFRKCQTLLMTDYDYGQTIGQNNVGSGDTYFSAPTTVVNNAIYNVIKFPGRLNIPTSLAIFAVHDTTLTNVATTGSTGFTGGASLGANSATVAASTFTSTGFSMQNTSGGNLTLTNTAGQAHYVAVGSYG